MHRRCKQGLSKTFLASRLRDSLDKWKLFVYHRCVMLNFEVLVAWDSS